MQNGSAETYANTFGQAEQAMQAGRYDEAEPLLLRAHQLGHSVKSEHLRAHRALIRLGWLQRRPVQVVSQCALLVLAWIFERR